MCTNHAGLGATNTVDFVLAVAGSLLGSTIGAQIGTCRIQGGSRLISSRSCWRSLVLLVCAKMLAGLLMTPSIMVALKGGH